jgi:defect-in-organelle-trafficking protein DotD
MLRQLADRAGYAFQVNGDQPPAPVVITLQVRQKTVIEVLRDAGLQAGTRADVTVDANAKIVELNYAPVSGS